MINFAPQKLVKTVPECIHLFASRHITERPWQTGVDRSDRNSWRKTIQKSHCSII